MRYDNAYEIAQCFVAEWHRQKVRDETVEEYEYDEDEYMPSIRGEFQVRIIDNRIYIDFTTGAFKTFVFMRHLNLPYKTAANFMSKISPRSAVRPENDGLLHWVRIDNLSSLVYTISMEVLK